MWAERCTARQAHAAVVIQPCCCYCCCSATSPQPTGKHIVAVCQVGEGSRGCAPIVGACIRGRRRWGAGIAPRQPVRDGERRAAGSQSAAALACGQSRRRMTAAPPPPSLLHPPSPAVEGHPLLAGVEGNRRGVGAQHGGRGGAGGLCRRAAGRAVWSGRAAVATSACRAPQVGAGGLLRAGTGSPQAPHLQC